MADMEIRKATRKKAKLRLGLVAPSGAGKTYSALLVAFGLGGKVGMIDTENGSGDLYAHLGDYDIINIHAPFTIAKYLSAIRKFEESGYDTIVIDSLSHAWAGSGGLLDKQGKIADSSGNSYTAWRTVTPEHNDLIDAMLTSKCHIIATMRTKTEYVMEEEERNGKKRTVPKKVGLAPVQRDGMDYEFTTVFDIDTNHIAKTSKDRTELFDGEYVKISTDTGKKLAEWLNKGEEVKNALSDITKLITDIGDVETANEALKAVMESDLDGNSQRVAKAKLNERIKELGLVYDKENKSFMESK